MTRPTYRNGTDNLQYRRGYPKDIKVILDGLSPRFRQGGWGKSEITISLGTSDSKLAAERWSKIHAEVEQRFAALRAGVRALTLKEATALAGEMYKAFMSTFEDDPGSFERWMKIEADNVAARVGKFGRGKLMIDRDNAIKVSLEERFGPFVEQALINKGLLVDDASRQKLVEQMALAVSQAAQQLMKAAAGDFRPDPDADRFPEWINKSAVEKKQAALPVKALFERWASHPEQAVTAPRTIGRYRSVFNALSDGLKHQDATKVSKEELRAFFDGLMEKGVAPRTIRDVYRAAISSVFGWANGKGLIDANPVNGIAIKVVAKPQKRPKELTDVETQRVVKACLAVHIDGTATGYQKAQRWCPLLALYTGARIGEITQLRKEDIYLDGPAPYLRITPEAGTVKDKEYRDVPVHPRLVELGFSDFVRTAEEGHLFFDPKERRKAKANTPQSELVASKLAGWVKSVAAFEPPLARPLHGFRHRFTSQARLAGIDEQYSNAITGHSPGNIGRQYGAFPIAALYREVMKLDPETLEGKERQQD